LKTTTIYGQPSWRLRSTTVEAWLTRLGGHLGPVSFRLGRRLVSPYAVAPWAGEPLPAGTPAVLRVLRGDFLCLPFGGPDPMHGYTANARWLRPRLERDGDRVTFRAELRSPYPAGTVTKEITLRDGHRAVYSRHVLAGMSGRFALAHHPMLQFPAEASSGIIATSGLRFGQVRPGVVEDPISGGYSSLRPGAVFSSLRRVPRLDGGIADLTRYPARLGYEDFVMVASRSTSGFAWTAVTFPGQGYVWFLLKDPRVLPSTFFWFSNGGLHGPPARGRLRGVLGVEDIAGYFGYGPGEGPRPNPFQSRRHPTHAVLRPDRPLTVATIAGVAAIPRGFGRVGAIRATDAGHITLSSGRHRVTVPLDHGFIHDPASP
jgi:hypothetical protein